MLVLLFDCTVCAFVEKIEYVVELVTGHLVGFNTLLCVVMGCLDVLEVTQVSNLCSGPSLEAVDIRQGA